MTGVDDVGDIDAIVPDLSGEGLVVGIVTSRFNEEICAALRRSCIAELQRLGVRRDDMTTVSVAGALEIPLALNRLAATGQFQALVALGAVIRGETYHFEVVSDQSAAGIMRVGLDTGIPIANGVLTTDTDEQAMARMHIKGAEAARVAVEMANLLQAIEDERD
jgi:6,7-dimethyl-8-ribityllumazine synthase